MPYYKYPKTIEDYGFKHRRSYKYIELPDVMRNLEQAELLFIEFIKFKQRVKSVNFPLTEEEKRVKMFYEDAWLDYYGVDAQEHLLKYYGKDCCQWLEFRETLSLLLSSNMTPIQ